MFRDILIMIISYIERIHVAFNAGYMEYKYKSEEAFPNHCYFEILQLKWYSWYDSDSIKF